MKTDLIREWVTDLRDPGILQATGALRVVNDSIAAADEVEHTVAYCCLGVLCEVLVRHGLVERDRCSYRAVNDARDLTYGADEGWVDDVLPPGVADYLGLGAPDPVIEGDRLTTLNDEQHVGFPEIADLIEATWLR